MKRRLLAVLMLGMMLILSTSVVYAADYTYGSTTLGATQHRLTRFIRTFGRSPVPRSISPTRILTREKLPTERP